MQPKVQIKLERDGAKLPTYATDGAAGADVYACVDYRITLEPGERRIIPLGFSMKLPKDFEAQIRPRSGIAIKQGVTVLNAPGTIDADYRGEVGVMLLNCGSDPFVVNNGDRIAQMVIAYAPQHEFVQVNNLDETERGAGGFGSTGVSS